MLRIRALEIDIVIEMEQRLVTLRTKIQRAKISFQRAASLLSHLTYRLIWPLTPLKFDGAEVILRSYGVGRLTRTEGFGNPMWLVRCDVGCCVDNLTRTALAPFNQSLLQVTQYEGLRYRSQIDTLLYVTTLVYETDNDLNVFWIVVGTEHL